MNSFLPKVSIIIPVYNGADYMKKAIDSALSQTYQNIEIVVVNDGSNDHGVTDEIACSYGSQIKYFIKENGGVASALNLAIEKMSGDYFSWLSHDDMYYPQKIEKQISALAEVGDPGAVCVCNVTVIDEYDQKIKSNHIASRANRSMRCFLATDTDTGLNGCSLLVPKQLFMKCGGFNPNLKATQDYDLWFKFTYDARFILLEDELVLSRFHEKQNSRTMGILPTIEADKMHALMLSKIETAEMREYLGDDLDYLLNAYKIYRNAGYRKTAARLYAIAIKFGLDLGDRKRAARLFATQLLPARENSLENAQNNLDMITHSFLENHKPTMLVYCNVWVKGGIERVISILMAELTPKYNFILVSHASNEYLEGFTIGDEVCHIVIRPELVPEIPYVLLLLAELSNASLVIVNPNINIDTLKIYPVMKDSEIKTIACNHYYYFLPTWLLWLYPIMAERLTYLKDATVATWLNTFNANAYALNNSNGAIMPNPNTFEICDEPLSQPSGNIVLCVGRFYDTIKRLDRTLKVFKKVLAMKPDAQLVLVGDYKLDIKVPFSSSETIGELLDRLDFPQGSVTFVGEQESVAPYYQKASVLILSSESEGFSLVLTEAACHGVPAVIFDIPGLDDLITDGLNGFIIAQDDLSGMAEKVVEILSNYDLRHSMRLNSREMSKQFDRKVICERWSKLIDRVLAAENNEAFEKQAVNDFMEPPKDMQQFIKNVAREYERSLKKIIQESYAKETVPPPVIKDWGVQVDKNGKESLSVAAEPASMITVPREEFTEKEYRVLAMLRRIRNNPTFHYVYVDLVKPVYRAPQSLALVKMEYFQGG